MSLVQTFGSLALVVLGIFLILWAIREIFQVKSQIVTLAMIVCAIVAGVGLFISH